MDGEPQADDAPTSPEALGPSEPAPAGPGPSVARRGLGFAAALLIWVLVAGLPLFLSAERPVVAFDAGWHLATGRLIVETGEVPRRDTLCATSGDVDWVNLAYLAEAGMYRVYLLGGIGACLLVFNLGAALANLLLFVWLLRRRQVAPLWGLLACGAVAYLLGLWFNVRPRAFTYVLAVALLLLLHTPDAKWSWRRAGGVCALLVAWIQLHGGFIYAFAILGLDFLASAIDARRLGDPESRRRALRVGAASSAGLLLGFSLHAHGFDALRHAYSYPIAVGSAGKLVWELAPLYEWVFVHKDLQSIVSSVVLFGALAAALIARRTTPERAPLALREALTIAFFLLLTMRYVRALPLTGLVVLPWCAVQLSRRFPLSARLAPLRFAWQRLPAAVLVGVALWGLVRLPSKLSVEQSPRTPGDILAPAWRASWRLPVRAGVWLQRAPKNVRFYNHYHSGGLLVWALYPQRRTFIDGRGDLHNYSGAWHAHLLFSHTREGWEEQWRTLGFDVALVHKSTRLERALEERGWRLVVEDPKWKLLAEPSFYEQIPARMRLTD